MNKLTLQIIASVSIGTLANAATYTVQNSGTPALDPRIADSSGTLFTDLTGSATFGFFTDDNAVTNATSATDLLDSDFTQFGSNEGTFNTTDFITGDGLFSIAGNSVDTAFNDQNIYLVVGNNTDLSLADEFFVFKFDEKFTGVDGTGTPFVNFTSTVLGTTLIGEAGPTVNTGFFTDVPTFRTEAFSAVPEPSSTALLGLGSVALLLRRRR